MKYRHKSGQHENRNQRLRVYLYAVSLILLVLFGQLVYVQLIDRKGNRVKAGDILTIRVKLEPERGRIMDRNREVLAFNIPAIDVVADPSQVTHHYAVANRLSPIIGKKPDAILKSLRSEGNFAYLARGLYPELENKIRELKFSGIRCQKVWKRRYPKGALASNLIGFINRDGVGLSGLELAFDPTLAGVPGEEVELRTATATRFYRSEYPKKLPENGQDLILTIDWHYQYIAEKELYEAVVASGAESGVVIIMNPHTGEILSLASVPHFDANRAGEYPPSSWRLRAITDQYDPGSTMKIVMMSALLNEGLRSPDDMVFCRHGRLQLNDRVIVDSHPYDWLSLRDVLVHSSNIGMALTMREIDPEIIYDYLNAFGFGVKTGVELVGEVNGRLNPYYLWQQNTPMALAIGYEISVNALQMACAFSTIANGGYLIRPTIIKEFRSSDKKITNHKMRVIRRVLKPSTVETMKSIMHEVVMRGTATKANIDGIQVCGKTGTARILREDGSGFETNRHIASFGGWLDMENPKLCVFVLLRDPQADYFGGDVAAPVFKRICTRIIQKEGMDYFLSDQDDHSDITAFEKRQKRAPSLVGYSKSDANRLVRKKRMDMTSIGEGNVVLAQQPDAGTILEENQSIEVVTERTDRGVEGIVVPQVIGLPLRRALNLLSAKNIQAVVDGSGRVVRQTPQPGQRLRSNEQVLLHCESSIDIGKLLAL